MNIPNEIFVALVAAVVTLIGATVVWVRSTLETHARQAEDERKRTQQTFETKIAQQMSDIQAHQQNAEALKGMVEALNQTVTHNGEIIQLLKTNNEAVAANTSSVDESAREIGELVEATRKLHEDVRDVLKSIPELGGKLEQGVQRIETALKKLLEKRETGEHLEVQGER